MINYINMYFAWINVRLAANKENINIETKFRDGVGRRAPAGLSYINAEIVPTKMQYLWLLYAFSNHYTQDRFSR